MTDFFHDHSRGRELELLGIAGDGAYQQHPAGGPTCISVPPADHQLTLTYMTSTESQRLEQRQELYLQARAGPRNSSVIEEDDGSPAMVQPVESDEDGPEMKSAAAYRPCKFWKIWLPLVVFAAFVWSLVIALSIVLTQPTSESQYSPNKIQIDDEKCTTDDAREGSRCLWQLNNRFLGTNVFRLEFGAPQLKATEWLAVHDRACSYMDFNSDQMEQRYALMVLYFAMGGKDWGFSGWAQPDVSDCDWQNVGCNSEKEITDLDIDTNYASGRLPEEIGRLSSLRSLDLSRNSIRGTIPKALYSLTHLVLLELGINKFVGSIDTRIGSLTNLEFLDLSANLLTGILPSSLRSLTRLKTFDVSENSLFEGDLWSIIPLWSELEQFVVRGTKISGTIPTEIGGMSSLHSIVLDSTATTGTIPTQIGLMSSLLLFFAISVPLDGEFLPSEIGQLSLLESFKIRDTNMIGVTIPTEFGLCASLEFLLLGDSGLIGHIPSELGLLSALREFRAEENELTGSIPVEFHRLSNLEHLDLSLNTGIEPVSSSLCNIVQQAFQVACNVACPCCDRKRC